MIKARQKDQGDDEAQGIDEVFIDAYVDYFVLALRILNVLIGLNTVFLQREAGVSESTALSCSSRTRPVSAPLVL